MYPRVFTQSSAFPRNKNGCNGSCHADLTQTPQAPSFTTRHGAILQNFLTQTRGRLTHTLSYPPPPRAFGKDAGRRRLRRASSLPTPRHCIASNRGAFEITFTSARSHHYLQEEAPVHFLPARGEAIDVLTSRREESQVIHRGIHEHHLRREAFRRGKPDNSRLHKKHRCSRSPRKGSPILRKRIQGRTTNL